VNSPSGSLNSPSTLESGRRGMSIPLERLSG
jgi:hypothetical protein